MNREIKFRVWEKSQDPTTEGLMWTWDEIKRTKIENLQSDKLPMYLHLPLKWFAKDSNYIFMQYTGLDDKSGQELYEGDIVEVDTFEPNIEQTVTFKAKIEWLYKAFFVTALKHVDFSDFLGYWIGDDIKVIGNKFEDPELLEDN